MLVKTGEVKEVNNRIQVIYKNELTGKTGVLAQHSYQGGSRKATRKGITPIRVRTNRKTTKGRMIHFQTIGQKIIKHVQETSNAIRRKTSFLDVQANIELRASKYDKSKKNKEN